MKINLFLAQTEYHLLQSINIATTLYNSKDEKNIIYVIKTKRRLANLHEIPKIDRIVFKYIEDATPKKKDQTIRTEKCDKFIFFQEDSLFNCNLAYYFKKKFKAVIILAPDGYKPYAVYNKKHEKLSMLRDTFEAYKYLIKKTLFQQLYKGPNITNMLLLK